MSKIREQEQKRNGMMFSLKSLYQLPEEQIERIYFSFVWVIRILLIGALILEGIYQQWEFFFVTGLAFLLTLLPSFFERRYDIKTPPEFHLFIVIFIYAGIYLGEVRAFYLKLFWWDTLLHTLAGFVLGIVGLAVMFIFYEGNKIKAKPGIVVFFAFCFSTTLGVIWEIFEFFMDTTFGLNMQKVHVGTGVTDTMIDLIVNTIGAIIACTIGYFYLKYGKSSIYNRTINYLIVKNPRLFRKIQS